MVAIFFISIILFFLTVDFFVQRYTFRTAAAQARVGVAQERLSRAPELVPVPAGVFVDPTHTWLRLAPSGVVRVGADALASALLGSPDAVELKAPGEEVGRGEVIATLRKGGRRLELRSPVDGVVAAANTALAESPSSVAEAPFGSGWLYHLKPRRLGETLGRMRIAEDAAAWMRAEAARFRDAVASLARPAEPVGATALDGGVPVPAVASALDDEGFERLAESFFNPAPTPAEERGADAN